MTINLDSLPLEIYKKIPLNIKTYKKEYEISELPYDIQKLVGEYNQEKNIEYKDKIYDFTPTVSKYGDFTTLNTLRATVLDSLQNYLQTTKKQYPFNSQIGTDLKKFIQKKDTMLQKLYLTEELNNMINSFSTSLDNSIQVKDFKIVKQISGTLYEYTLYVSLIVVGESTNITTSFIL